MPNSVKHQKISKKLIVYIILFSSMITAIVTLIQLYYQYVEDKSILDKNIENINTGYREGITNAVWLDDKVQLNSILDGVVALPDIEYIEVRVNDKVYSSRGSSVDSNALNSSFQLHYRHNNRLLNIGETYVEADLSAIYQRLVNRAWTILALNAVKTFIVAIFMYFIFDRLVVSRLDKLSRFVRRYDIQDINKKVDIESLGDNGYSDEITEIVTALNTMQGHLSQSIKQLLGLKRTLDLSLDSIFMCNPETYKIFYTNAGAAALLGYSADELIDMSSIDICDELTDSLFSELALSKSNPEQRVMDFDTLFKRKHGEPVPVRIVLQYLHPPNEEPRYVFMARDVSERLRAQREIQASLEEAKAANAELESFSYSISHDLRAPLRSIDGFSLLIMQDYGAILDDEGKNYLHKVRNNAQRMGLLIDDLLSLSQVTRGEFNRKLYDISKMAKASVKKLQDYEPDRKVAVDIAPGVKGWVDKSLFENLLDNLIGNAWKYTSKKEDSRIEFGATTKGDETVYYVRDNGVGFDMQYADKLYNAFERLHEDEDFKGTGIGLATVSRILKRHGGRIWAESETGHGATFYFTLEDQLELPGSSTVKRQAKEC
jgi:PAS domain S-box-containing protein